MVSASVQSLNQAMQTPSHTMKVVKHYYVILKNPFKNSSLERVLHAIGKIPYFYDISAIIGAYTYAGGAYHTSREYLENSGHLYSTGWIYMDKGDSILNSIRDSLPVNLADSPNGWLVACIREPFWAGDEFDWKSCLSENIKDIGRELDDTYYPLVFPEHCVEGNFYIVETVPTEMIPPIVIEPEKMRADLDTALCQVNDAVKDVGNVANESYRTECYTHIPVPVYYPPSDLLFEIDYNVAHKHFGDGVKLPGLSIITSNNEIVSMKSRKKRAYGWCKMRTNIVSINAPNGWICINGTPEQNKEYIEKIYEHFGIPVPALTAASFATVITKDDTYKTNGVTYYPVCPPYYIVPLE